ncbi:hypothetical protein D3C71_1682930 [compost metagenome]
MGMRIQFGAHGHIRADQLAHAAQDVAFAIVIAIGDHGAVQAQQHHVHRQRGAQIRQQFIAQGLVGGARGDAARLRRCHQPFGQRPPRFAALQARHIKRRAGEADGIGMRARRVIVALLKGRKTGGHGREGVGLGAQAGAEDLHGCAPGQAGASAAAHAAFR